MLTVQQLRVVCVAEVRGLRKRGQENLTRNMSAMVRDDRANDDNPPFPKGPPSVHQLRGFIPFSGFF